MVPQIGGEIMERSRLIESFTGSKAGIVYITAAAGFGKTVLLVQLAGAAKKPVVWYHLDSYDNDPALFLRYLIAGCQKHYPDFGRDIVSFINNNIQTNPISIGLPFPCLCRDWSGSGRELHWYLMIVTLLLSQS
jgi:ATP/maltotriose-dependent transcriptional regulator MalT